MLIRPFECHAKKQVLQQRFLTPSPNICSEGIQPIAAEEVADKGWKAKHASRTNHSEGQIWQQQSWTTPNMGRTVKQVRMDEFHGRSLSSPCSVAVTIRQKCKAGG